MRYYLHIREDECLIQDVDGGDYPNLDAARDEATAGVRDILAEQLKSGRLLRDFAIEIWNDAGEILDTVAAQSVIQFA